MCMQTYMAKLLRPIIAQTVQNSNRERAMRKIKAKQERVTGLLNGKRIKTTVKEWETIIADPKNKVVLKDGQTTDKEG